MWVPRIMQKWLPVQKGERYHIEGSPFPVFIEQPDMVRRDAERAAPLFCFLARALILFWKYLTERGLFGFSGTLFTSTSDFVYIEGLEY